MILVLALLLLAACAVPPASEKSIIYQLQHPVVENVSQQEPVVAVKQMEVVVPVAEVTVKPSLERLEARAKAFADAWQRFDVPSMYSYLYEELRQRIDPVELADVLLYFKPKDRAYVNFEEIRSDGTDYWAVMQQGNDYTGWKTYVIPFVHESGEWNLQWGDEYSTREGIIASCGAKTSMNDTADAKVAAARALSASSCMEAGALAIDDPTICPYAVYNRDRCYRDLGIVMTKQQRIDMCKDTTGVKDNITIAQCLYDLAVSESDVAICKMIEKNRVERYFCIGELSAVTHAPENCNDAINDYTMRLCLEKYIDETQSTYDICRDPKWKTLVDC
jgi:hypothetical protein